MLGRRTGVDIHLIVSLSVPTRRMIPLALPPTGGNRDTGLRGVIFNYYICHVRDDVPEAQRTRLSRSRKVRDNESPTNRQSFTYSG